MGYQWTYSLPSFALGDPETHSLVNSELVTGPPDIVPNIEPPEQPGQNAAMSRKSWVWLSVHAWAYQNLRARTGGSAGMNPPIYTVFPRNVTVPCSEFATYDHYCFSITTEM